MAELAIGQLIKIIIGILVVVVVVMGVGLYFKNNVVGFFDGLPGENESVDGSSVSGSSGISVKEVPKICEEKCGKWCLKGECNKISDSIKLEDSTIFCEFKDGPAWDNDCITREVENKKDEK